MSILDLSRHQYYYKPKGHRPGRKPSQTTLKQQEDQIVEVDNREVVDKIKETQADPDTDFGYRKMSTLLKPFTREEHRGIPV